MNLLPLLAGGSASEELVLRLLYQLIVILIVTRIVVFLARRLWQTDVSGEILAGLLLGPSLLGALAPELMDDLFHESTTTVFTALAQLGLVLLMFQIGLEFEFGTVFRTAKKTVATISLIGIAVPFTMGFLLAPLFHGWLPEATKPDMLGFRLFFGVAMSITAIPILGRIFMELGLSHTRLAAITIGAASIDDVVGWLLLGTIALIVADDFHVSWAIWHIAGLAAYLFAVFLIVRPVLRRFIDRTFERDGGLTTGSIAVILIALFASASITSNLDVFAIIGGFVIGVALHEDRRFVEAWRVRVSPLVYGLLLPLFFTLTGLRTDIGTLGNLTEVGILALVVLVAFSSKMIGAYVGGRFLGLPHLEASAIAVAMNTRALMELVALNIGFELGVVPPSMYTKLVLMAVISTFIATPLIARFMKDQRIKVETHPPPEPEPAGAR